MEIPIMEIPEAEMHGAGACEWLVYNTGDEDTYLPIFQNQILFRR
jgi:hypothetical protein